MFYQPAACSTTTPRPPGARGVISPHLSLDPPSGPGPGPGSAQPVTDPGPGSCLVSPQFWSTHCSEGTSDHVPPSPDVTGEFCCGTGHPKHTDKDLHRFLITVIYLVIFRLTTRYKNQYPTSYSFSQVLSTNQVHAVTETMMESSCCTTKEFLHTVRNLLREPDLLSRFMLTLDAAHFSDEPQFGRWPTVQGFIYVFTSGPNYSF